MIWFLIVSLIGQAVMVKQQDFKTCAQSAFCVRQRAFADIVDDGYPSFWSVEKYDIGQVVTLDCLDSFGSKFSFKLTPYETAFRLSVGIDGAFGNTQEYATENLFDIVPYKHDITNSSVVLTVGSNKVVISTIAKAFKIEFWRNDVPVIVFNNKGYLHLEKNREINNELNVVKKDLTDLIRDLNMNMGPETFNGNTDSKPKG